MQTIKQRMRLVWVLAIILLPVLLYLALPPLLNAAARQLMREDPLQQADVIIALGGDSMCLREHWAAQLYQRGLGRKVIVSGQPFAWGGNSGEAKKKYLLHLGLPAADIVILDSMSNTRTEADGLIQLMKQQNWQSALVVTSPYHARRALFTLERRAANLRFVSAPLPAQTPEWMPQRWWTRRSDLRYSVREFLAWGNTLAGGWQ